MCLCQASLLEEDKSIGQITHLGKVWYLILGNGIPGFVLFKNVCKGDQSVRLRGVCF